MIYIWQISGIFCGDEDVFYGWKCSTIKLIVCDGGCAACVGGDLFANAVHLFTDWTVDTHRSTEFISLQR